MNVKWQSYRRKTKLENYYTRYLVHSYSNSDCMVSAQAWRNRLMEQSRKSRNRPHGYGHLFYNKSGICRAVGSSLFFNWYWVSWFGKLLKKY